MACRTGRAQPPHAITASPTCPGLASPGRRLQRGGQGCMWGTEKGPQESEVTTAPGATPTGWCSGQGFQPPGTPPCVCSLTGHTLKLGAPGLFSGLPTPSPSRTVSGWGSGGRWASSSSGITHNYSRWGGAGGGGGIQLNVLRSGGQETVTMKLTAPPSPGPSLPPPELPYP